MANSSKAKGDRFEREAVAVLAAAAPDLVRPNPRRKLGAGRRDDVGDLDVFDDVTIQVRALGDITRALRSAADDAVVQGGRAGTRWAVGMVPMPHARSTGIRWLCSTYGWPTGAPDPSVVCCRTGLTVEAIEACRSATSAVPPSDRLAIVARRGQPDLIVATLGAWLVGLRSAKQLAVAPGLSSNSAAAYTAAGFQQAARNAVA